MNQFLLALAMGLIFSQEVLAQNLSKVKEFQSEILQMRAQEILMYRREGLEKCLASNKGYTSLQHQRFQSDIKFITSGRFDSKQERLEETLRTLALTEKHPKCGKEIAEADSKLNRLQRKKFDIPIKTARGLCLAMVPPLSFKCLKTFDKMIQELDPFCVTQNSKNFFGVKDPNACMAGDRLLGKTVRQKNDPEQKRIHRFLSDLESKIAESKNNGQIDLWKIYLKTNKDTPENRKNFLALTAFFYYTLGTAGGYVDGIADHYWQSALKESQYPEDAFYEFYSMRQKVDWYGHLIHKQAKKKNLQFTIKHVSIKGMNRHDFMAMFLSCHFREYGPIAPRVIPSILGLAYESLDFVSHIKEDVGLEVSAKNFKKDTSRYTVGSTLGNGFCAYKF